jgi:hypothetical protein
MTDKDARAQFIDSMKTVEVVLKLFGAILDAARFLMVTVSAGLGVLLAHAGGGAFGVMLALAAYFVVAVVYFYKTSDL